MRSARAKKLIRETGGVIVADEIGLAKHLFLPKSSKNTEKEDKN